MEGYRTGAVVGRVRGILDGDRSWSSVTTTAPEEYADKDEKNTSAYTNSNGSDDSSGQPLGFNSIISTTKYPETLPLRWRRFGDITGSFDDSSGRPLGFNSGISATNIQRLCPYEDEGLEVSSLEPLLGLQRW